MNLMKTDEKNSKRTFPAEVFYKYSIASTFIATLTCVIYYWILGNAPSIWFVGGCFNLVWLFFMYEAVFSCYRKGAVDQMQTGEAYKV